MLFSLVMKRLLSSSFPETLDVTQVSEIILPAFWFIPLSTVLQTIESHPIVILTRHLPRDVVSSLLLVPPQEGLWPPNMLNNCS